MCKTAEEELLKEYYLGEANKHADFLVEEVFKPAFVMAFMHGIKHGRKDILKELAVKNSNKIHTGELKKSLEKIRAERGYI